MFPFTNTITKRILWSLGLVSAMGIGYYVACLINQPPSNLQIFEFESIEVSMKEDPILKNVDVPVLNLLNRDYVKLAKSVEPSLVCIETKGAYMVKNDKTPSTGKEKKLSTRGQGSGVIVTSQGHIITAKHVIDRKRTYSIKLFNGRMVGASLVGVDDLLDIAVLKINDHIEFTPLQFGNSDLLLPGQFVMACGNPFGLGTSVTRGIVNAKMRRLHSGGPKYIQTDAAIYPGNSGGPLVDIHGSIIGINQAVLGMDEQYFRGVSFAIPSNLVMHSFKQICRYGKPIRGILGMETIEFGPSMRTHCQYSGTMGILVNLIFPKSPADLSGLCEGDIILSLNGHQIENLECFYTVLDHIDIYSANMLKVWRQGSEVEVKLEVSPNAHDYMKEVMLEKLGMLLRNTNFEERMNRMHGVIVTDVIDEKSVYSPIKRGDIIYRVNDTMISSLDELKKYLDRGAVKVFFMRSDGSQGSIYL